MRAGFVGIAAAAWLSVAPVRAETAAVSWPTFFRVGPSQHHEVVDELLRGTKVDVRSCTDQWCLVQYGRALGYVQRTALNGNDFPAAATTSGIPCFDSTRAGYGKGEVTRYCRR